MKNYIEEYMKDNGLNKNETYLFKNYFDKDGNMHELNIIFGECYDITVNNDFASGEVYRQILKGVAIIEKIKPKTLMEQLKEQGFGYAINIHAESGVEYAINIHAESGVEYVNVNNSIFNALLKMGAMYLTESDCKREIYRRELKFEIEEYCRKNDIDFRQTGSGFQMSESNDLNIILNNASDNKVVSEQFKDKISKCMNWEGLDE